MKSRFAPFHRNLKQLSCALLIAALLLCAGCGQRPTLPPAPAASLSGDQSAAEEVFAPAPSQVPQEPVRQITALSPCSVPSFAELEDGVAFVCWTEFSEDGEHNVTYFNLLDLEQDQVVASGSIDRYLDLKQSFPDGTVLLQSYDENCFYLMDQSLQPTRLDVPTTEGQFSSDHSRYYYVEGDTLYELTLSTGQRSPVVLAQGLRPGWLDHIHPTQDYLTGWFYTSPYNTQLCYGLLDCSTGGFLLLNEQLVSLEFYEDQFQGYLYDYESAQNLLIWGPLTGDAPLNSADLSPYEDGYSTLQYVANSNYATLASGALWSDGEWDDGAERTVSTDLYRLDENGLSICPLAGYGLQDELLMITYLPQSELILAGIYREDGCSVVAIDPQMLDFTDAGAVLQEAPARVDQQLLDQYQADITVPELSPDLDEVRARADELEERYGIDILLSGECAAPCAASGYEVTTTDQAGWDNEASVINQGLDALESVLAEYPEGFFRQFGSHSGANGICFMPVGFIDSENPISVAAFESSLGPKEYIAYDCTLYGLDYNLYHEIWHAMENKINYSDFTGFYSGAWDACNPSENAYLYSYDLYAADEDLFEWTYFGGAEEVYFVDDYARTFPHEDRARIMEYVMGEDGAAQALLEYPAIRQKFQLMCEGIRAAFDTSGWDPPRWERFS